jgi:hypothetical protein
MIKMEDEMTGDGLRNVYTISMENLKGRLPPSWKMQAKLGKKYYNISQQNIV